jgi:DNA replication protein DnaC
MTTTNEGFKTRACDECGKEFQYQPVFSILDAMRELNVYPNCCDECKPILEERKRKEEEEDLKSYKAYEWSYFCPPIYLETDLSLLPKEQLKAATEWKPKGGKGLLLHGTTGKGKTRVAWEVLRLAYFKTPRDWYLREKIVALTAAQFSRQSSDHAAGGKSEQWANRLCGAPWLMIDDLGKGRLTERNESDLFDILDQRFAYKRPVIITTNTVGDELQKRLDPDRGAPLIRRLREFCDCIAF